MAAWMAEYSVALTVAMTVASKDELKAVDLVVQMVAKKETIITITNEKQQL